MNPWFEYILRSIERPAGGQPFVVAFLDLVMPKHFHLLISEPAKKNVARVMQVLKQRVSFRCRHRKKSAHQMTLSENLLAPAFWQSRYCKTAKVAALLLLFCALMMSAQTAPKDQGAQETQVRGFWIDPSTGLMWAGKDNGKGVSWKGSVKYCRDLRLAGYSDWRLATVAELKTIYDPNADAPGLAGPGKESSYTWHVKGNVFLTGYEWSSERINDDRGHFSGYAWYFNFNEGRADSDPSGFPYPSSFKRALCVRGSGK